MSSFHISEFNFDKTCRTCLKQKSEVSSLKPIFDDTITVEVLDEISNMRLKIAKGDGFPQLICAECVDCLVYINRFRQLCEKSALTLERFHRIEKLVSIEISPQNNIEFANVEFLHDVSDEIETGEKLKNYEEEVEHDNFRCSSSNDEWIQNDIVDAKPDLEFNKNQFYSNDEEMIDGEKDVCGSKSKFQCQSCDETFESIELLDAHIKYTHPIKNTSHVCLICGKYFTTAQNRNIHMESHNKSCDYKCDICDSVFKCKNYLAKHKRAIHTVEEHECPHCFIKFNNTNKYKYHLKTHDPNKKYKCKYCDKSFLQQHHLSNHERVHTGLRPYLCNICGKDFRQEHNFTLHLRTHNGDRPYVCSLCNKSFVQRGSFILHKRQHAGIRPYQCEHCGKHFYQKSSLNVHLRTHTGERPFECELCKKSFVQSPQLKYHKIAVHGTLTPINKNSQILQEDDNNELVPTVESELVTIKSENDFQKEKSAKNFLFKCSLCIKEFKLPSSLASHMKIHTEERKHLCTDCGNTFKRAEHLKVHINGVHLKQKPYSCEICHRCFSQVGDRNIHMLAHTGEKPHSCPHCSKRFRLQKALRAHIRIHTGEKPYKCEICNIGFTTYNALVVHTVKHPESLLSLAKESCLNQYVKND